MLNVSTDSRRHSRRFSILSTRSSGSSGRRSSFTVDDTAALVRPRRVRPKPRLDEATLAAKREYAASGLVLIMRRKAAQRRRFLREQAAVNGDLTAGGPGGQAGGTATGATIDMDEDGDTVSSKNSANSYLISAIPYLPKAIAIVCLVLNVLLPGTGTVLSGMAVFCCGKTRMQGKDEQQGTSCCVNLLVGLMQLFTVTFMLVGWAWSLVWGIYIVILAIEHEKDTKVKRDKELQAKALVAMNSQLRAWTITGQKPA